MCAVDKVVRPMLFGSFLFSVLRGTTPHKLRAGLLCLVRPNRAWLATGLKTVALQVQFQLKIDPLPPFLQTGAAFALCATDI